MGWSDAELDAAYDRASTGTVSTGGWSDADLDAAFDAANPSFNDAIQQEAGFGHKAASGFLSGIAGLGDLADLVGKYTPFGGGVIGKTVSVGDSLRSGIDYLTGVEGSTSIGEDSLAHKVGEYLPSTLMGPGAIGTGAAKGLLTSTAAKNMSKLLAGNAALGTVGYGGEQLGGPTGEIASVLAASSVPLTAQKVYGLLSDVPDQATALIKAFKVPETQVKKVAPALEKIKAQGIVASPNSATPFQDTAQRLDDAMIESRKAITQKLNGTSTTVAEIWPESSLFQGKVKSGADTKAALSALSTEQDNLVKFALAKKNPPPPGVDEMQWAEDLLTDYKAIEKAAKAGDPKSIAALKRVDDFIDNTPMTGDELWELRQSYDGSASWNRIEAKGKSQAYRAMRDSAQQRLLKMGGQGTDDLFDSFAAQMQSQKSVNKLAGAEMKGTTQAPNKLQSLVGNTLRAALAQTVGIGHMPATKPATSLKQAFGKTNAQKIIASNLPSNMATTGVIVGANRIDDLQTAPSTQEQTAQQKHIQESSTSSNYNTDKELVDNWVNKAEAKMALQPPKIIEAKRISGEKSEEFLDKEEGGQRLKAYPPPAKGSGVTVSTGVDLGQWSRADLQNAGVSAKTISKVAPYLGKKDATARMALKDKPLKLTKAEADELDTAIKEDIFGTVEAKLKDKGVNINKLPVEAQTVIKSISYNFGKNFDETLPSFFKAIIKKDWEKLHDLLINTKWKQPELKDRRIREAALLKPLIV